MTTADAYSVRYDRSNGPAFWLVVDADGDVFAENFSEAGAKEEALAMNREAEAVRLVDAITERVGDLQNESKVETLRMIAAMLSV